MLVSDDQGWRTVSHSVSGSYVVFPLTGSEKTVAVVETEPIHWQLPAAIAGGVAMLALVLFLTLRKRPKKPSQPQES